MGKCSCGLSKNMPKCDGACKKQKKSKNIKSDNTKKKSKKEKLEKDYKKLKKLCKTLLVYAFMREKQ